MWCIGMLVLVAAAVNGDVYMHIPRGSNNRLNGQNRERANNNRMYDSQNNNRGGYNVGDDQKFGGMNYLTGSQLTVEWTNQHSCGEKNSDCQVVVQYMCDDRLRDGTTTRTMPNRNDRCRDRDCNSDTQYGMNEDIDWYNNCQFRERNKGLFTADQNLKGETAQYTRQNPNGGQSGMECPEERDYYPYWHPTPWTDVAILTNDLKRCAEFQTESQNVKEKWSCVPPPGYMDALTRNRLRGNDKKYLPLNKAECEQIKFPIGSANTAKWTKTEAWGVPKPECIAAPKSRDNHNGNGANGFPNMYNWTIPNDLTGRKCALRMRYNISTTEFPITTDASKNKQGNGDTKVNIGATVGLSQAEATARGYVYENNPTVHPLSVAGNAGKKLELELAINTAQYGRTFQDRSHAFEIKCKPAAMGAATVHNVNVRGKRGNIVQVYPAVEYDFAPNVKEMAVGDFVHFQWAGSNRNPNNNDGQGRRGTDRSNVVMLRRQNYPEGTVGKAVPVNRKKGHFGNSYPLKLDYVDLMGLPRKDLVELALLVPEKAGRAKLSELDDAPAYYDHKPQKNYQRWYVSLHVHKKQQLLKQISKGKAYRIWTKFAMDKSTSHHYNDKSSCCCHNSKKKKK